MSVVEIRPRIHICPYCFQPECDCREQGEKRFVNMWVVYDHPQDFPNCFVARRWEGTRATPQFIIAAELERIRRSLKYIGCSLRIPRQTHDDPAILETWI